MLKFLALISVIGVYLLLLVGNVVSGTGSGLGCPDWPLCYGKLIPPLDDYHTLIEWSHRLVASLVGLLVLATAIAAWRQGLKLLSGLSLILLLVQAGLGGLTVRLELTSPEVTTAHLGFGFGLLAVMVIIMTRARASETLPSALVAENFSGLLWATTIVVFLQVLIGGYVRHTHSGLACLDFPFCNMQAYPAGLWVQLWHRAVGVLVAVMVGWLAIKASRMKQPRSVVLLTHSALGLVLVQILLGAWSVWSKLSVHVTTTHLGVAAAIFGLLVALCVKAFERPAPATVSSHTVSPELDRAGV
jgi:heme A synthase